MSNYLNAILSLANTNADGYLAVTNMTTRNAVTVQVTVGHKQDTFVLTSRETRLLNLGEQHADKRGTAVLVNVHHNGNPGDIAATGFVLDEGAAYSSTLTMVDPAMAYSNMLAGTHFRFGAPRSSEDFPTGTVFRAPLLLANITARPVLAHLAVDFTLDQVPLEF